ncbi:MAG: hypothetical protein AAB531_04310 [Patescibacteria group bacterium]
MKEREIIDTDNLTNRASRLLEQPPRSKKTGLKKFTFPAVALVLTIAAAACGGNEDSQTEASNITQGETKADGTFAPKASPISGSKKEKEAFTPEYFADGLPATLILVCELYVSSDRLGSQEGETERKLGHTLVGTYMEENMDDLDPRALYLSGVGLSLFGETAESFTVAYSAFRIAVKDGISPDQERLAKNFIKSYESVVGGGDIIIEAVIMADTIISMVDDLEANVCP